MHFVSHALIVLLFRCQVNAQGWRQVLAVSLALAASRGDFVQPEM
jgi:hypothetical protein